VARRARIDLSRVAASALETALNGEEPQRRRFGGARAVIAGAALATAARVVVTKAPSLARLPGVPDVSELGDRLRDRFADLGLVDEQEPIDDEEGYWDDDEDEDEGPEDQDGGDVGPDADAEEEWDDESDDDEPADEAGPDVEAEEEWDDEPEDEEPADEDDEPADDEDDEDDEDDDGPDAAEDAPPLALSNGGREHVDPVERPPEPPRRNGNESKPKAKAGRS
jgi:hypothetical protein